MIKRHQNDFRMPRPSEVWRHYKGDPYTVVGMAWNDEGKPYVVYTEFEWSYATRPQLYTQPLERFIEMVGHDVPRFDREPDRYDRVCPFIRGEE